MNKPLGVQLIVYSLLLAGLSCVVHHLAPASSRATLLAGLGGGGLCLLWGIRALAGSRGKAWPILTLVPVSFVMLSQAVLGWSAGSEDGNRLAAALVTVLMVLSVAMLMRIAYAGVVFDGQPASPAKEPGTPVRSARQTGPAFGGPTRVASDRG